MPIFVNQTEITDDDVYTELQYHPAEEFEAARNAAAQALIVKELLLQKAIEDGVCARADNDDEIEKATLKLVETCVTAPVANKKACETYYRNNLDKFKDADNPERRVPFESVEEKIRDYLHTQSVRTGIQSFIIELAAEAKISGFDLEASL